MGSYLLKDKTLLVVVYKGKPGLVKHLFSLLIATLPAAMLASKAIVVVLFLCFVHQSVSKPATENEATERPGYLRSFWSWITSWWHSEETVQSITEQLVQSTTTDPNNIGVNVARITIWCNDQTCTTMKCDKTQCRNITCSLYDTDFRGECREYNVVTEATANTDIKSTETTTDVSIQSKPIDTPSINNSPAEKSPLESETASTSAVQQPEQPPIEKVEKVATESIQIKVIPENSDVKSTTST